MHDPIVNMIELHQAGTCRCVTGDRPPVSGMSWLGDEQALSASMGTDQGPRRSPTRTRLMAGGCHSCDSDGNADFFAFSRIFR